MYREKQILIYECANKVSRNDLPYEYIKRTITELVELCVGKADSTSEKDLRVCEVSNRASKPHCWGKMTWILKYESGKEPPHYVCSCEHGNRECLRLTRELNQKKKQC